MTLKPLLWTALVTASVTAQAQPIDQPLSETFTEGSSAFRTIKAAQLKDFNDDNLPDLIWVGDGKIYQAYGTGGGYFDAATVLYDDNVNFDTTYEVFTNPNLDLNQDGVQDIIAKRPNNAASPEVSRLTFFVSNPSIPSMVPYTFAEFPLHESKYGIIDYTDIDADGSYELISYGSVSTPGSGAPYYLELKTFRITVDANGAPTAVNEKIPIHLFLMKAETHST